jgi:hypothetical protein
VLVTYLIHAFLNSVHLWLISFFFHILLAKNLVLIAGLAMLLIISSLRHLMLRTDGLCATEQVMDWEGWVGETMLGSFAGFLKYAEMDRYQNSMFLERKQLVSVAMTSHISVPHSLTFWHRNLTFKF